MYVFFGGNQRDITQQTNSWEETYQKKPGALVIYGKFKEASRTLNDWGMRIMTNKQQIYTYI